MLFVCHPKFLYKHCLQFLLEVNMAPRETENNAYAKFWAGKQRALWYVMVIIFCSGQLMLYNVHVTYEIWSDCILRPE